MNRTPIIGITTDYQEKVNSYSKYPWFALRRHYTECLEIFECSPIILPITKKLPNLDILDGIMISGGDFDIDPSFYGQKITSNKVQTIPERTDFEMQLIDQFLSTNKPILGICGGCQLLNVYFGGSLIQDIQSSIEHEQPNPRNETSHEITFPKGSPLEIFTDNKKTLINSAHHQAVDKLGKNLTVTGMAPDGIVEGFEHESHYYCVGAQWHPEFLITDFDKKFVQDFVNHVKKNI
jgi:putative glutamine amidotransferase